MSKIIFADFDGVFITARSQWLPDVQGKTSFDPCAVSLFNKLLELDVSIKVVISSSHATFGGPSSKEHVKELLIANGIDWNVVHSEWRCPKKMSSSRAQEIKWWLGDHPEVTHYVAIDDTPLSPDFVKYHAQCNQDDGFSWVNYQECRLALGLFYPGEDEQAAQEKINYLKRKQIWNTYREYATGSYHLREAAELVHPSKVIKDTE